MVNQISYLIDTNTISELVKTQPNINVLQQFQNAQDEISIPSIVWHELRFGWLNMLEGQRKRAIGAFLHNVVSLIPILDYDAHAAKLHAEIRIQTQTIGKNIPFVDGQIAAIAMANGLILITRNIKDFQNIEGLRLRNWFEL
ncbi:type II toxin-antitoxin system VapC family toxin [Acinetobacter puyangensis]|uniref:tRNA(fMet)-specific endonuclease VapC n=1 Tax=Acinetobacter puyangensis TaxID=1096779 RepID=A0A240E8V4_9GAMM|nr:type II toxin-antitoxin system VapC family toxin [Acinetobacter puyangensis]SNX44673.1 tRNA(fMet)-specific endonuclease VapC [Acinetobacter puyangensis]